MSRPAVKVISLLLPIRPPALRSQVTCEELSKNPYSRASSARSGLRHSPFRNFGPDQPAIRDFEASSLRPQYLCCSRVVLALAATPSRHGFRVDRSEFRLSCGQVRVHFQDFLYGRDNPIDSGQGDATSVQLEIFRSF